MVKIENFWNLHKSGYLLAETRGHNIGIYQLSDIT